MDSVRDSCYGQHDANWLAFYDYFKTVTKLDQQTQKLAGHWEVSQSMGWWLPHKNICWASERHNALTRDEDGRLHCENGPALAYPDGWSLWSIHGVQVDEQVIMQPETQTVQQIESEANEERRRVRTERYGWPKYLSESKSTIVDSRRNDVDGTEERLFKIKDGSQRLLCACRSTARVYAVGVPREIKSCQQAQSWMAGGSSLVANLNVVGAS